MSGRSDLGEVLRRTRLVRVLLAYLGGSFAALEPVDLPGDKMALPDWVFAGAVVLLLIGLPVVIATALIQAGPSDLPPSVAPSSDDQLVIPVGSGSGARRIVADWTLHQLAGALRRARLIRVLPVYLGASFAVLEAIDLITDKIG